MKFFYSCLCGLMLWSYSAQAQLYPMPTTVLKGNDTLKTPSIGGLAAPQFSSADLNHDGIDDLLILDRVGQKLLTFINKGTPNTVDYVYSPAYEKYFPSSLQYFVLMYDYNCDGVDDLFTYSNANGLSIGVWKGRYEQDTLKFSLAKTRLQAPTGIIPNIVITAFAGDIPALEDVDGDGDVDLAVFGNGLSTAYVQFYRNKSVERGFGCDSLLFDYEQSCFGQFAETATNNRVTLSPSTDSCSYNRYWKRSGAPRHAGSSISFIDANGDNVYDLAMGDVSVSSLNMVTLDIVRDTFLGIQQDYNYPSYDTSVDLYSYPSTAFFDVDNDGKKDMLTGVAEIGITAQARADSVAWFYKNVTTGSGLDLRIQTKDFLGSEMVVEQNYSAPTFLDYNQDGLLDILVGSQGKIIKDSINLSTLVPVVHTHLTLYENIGNDTTPVFKRVSGDLLGLDTMNFRFAVPTAGDIDGDGDDDIFVGFYNGTVSFIENLTNGTGNVHFAPPVHNYIELDFEDAATPQLVDANRDGLLDFIIGCRNGNIFYFENVGTATSAAFSSRPDGSRIGGIDLNSLGGSGWSQPHLVDVNGTWDVYIGEELGNILRYSVPNTGDATTEVYTLESRTYSDFYPGLFSRVAVADIDSDDTLDFVIGNARGGLSFLSMAKPKVLVATQDIATRYNQMRLYPNPAQTHTFAELPFKPQGEEMLRIYDTLGRLVWTQNVKHQITQIPTAQFADGFYFIEVRQNETVRYRSKLRVAK